MHPRLVVTYSVESTAPKKFLFGCLSCTTQFALSLDVLSQTYKLQSMNMEQPDAWLSADGRMDNGAGDPSSVSHDDTSELTAATAAAVMGIADEKDSSAESLDEIPWCAAHTLRRRQPGPPASDGNEEEEEEDEEKDEASDEEEEEEKDIEEEEEGEKGVNNYYSSTWEYMRSWVVSIGAFFQALASREAPHSGVHFQNAHEGCYRCNIHTHGGSGWVFIPKAIFSPTRTIVMATLHNEAGDLVADVTQPSGVPYLICGEDFAPGWKIRYIVKNQLTGLTTEAWTGTKPVRDSHELWTLLHPGSS